MDPQLVIVADADEPLSVTAGRSAYGTKAEYRSVSAIRFSVMSDPMLFERSPEPYLRARPGYPAELWALLAQLGVAREGARVMDIGAGTGQATGPLLQQGAEVDAVEPGKGLASLLRKQFPAVHVQERTAEAASYPARAYDGVVCATALHWFDLAVALPQFRQCLRPGGRLVPFWNVFFDPHAEPTPFREVINTMFGGPPMTKGTPLDETHWSSALTEDGLFDLDAVHTWRWTHRMSSQQVHDLLSTFNGWTGDQIDIATNAAQRLGGTITEHYTTIAYVCRPSSK